MRIGIVNDLKAACEALRRVVDSLPDHEVVWTASDGVEANFSTRVKMGLSSVGIAVPLTGVGKVLVAKKEVKVTLGCCGG